MIFFLTPSFLLPVFEPVVGDLDSFYQLIMGVRRFPIAILPVERPEVIPLCRWFRGMIQIGLPGCRLPGVMVWQAYTVSPCTIFSPFSEFTRSSERPLRACCRAWALVHSPEIRQGQVPGDAGNCRRHIGDRKGRKITSAPNRVEYRLLYRFFRFPAAFTPS